MNKVQKRLALAVVILTLSLGVFTYLYFSRSSYDPEVIPADKADFVLATSTIPTKIIIPKLNIDANIQDVGITRSGKMATPEGETIYQDVGWYRYGPRPGEVGSAVMAGHFDNGYNKPAVFYKIAELVPGDTITVSYPDGQVANFLVKEKETYPIADAPLEKIFGNNGKKMLKLITCEGEWNPISKEYSERTVIFAEYVD